MLTEFFQTLSDGFPLLGIPLGVMLGFFLLGRIWRELHIFITGGTDDEQDEPEAPTTHRIGSEIVYGPSGDHFMYDDQERKQKPAREDEDFITCAYCGAANTPKARACTACGAPRGKAFSS